MPFINVSTYLISDACVLLAVERESRGLLGGGVSKVRTLKNREIDKGGRRGSEYPKPQS